MQPSPAPVPSERPLPGPSVPAAGPGEPKRALGWVWPGRPVVPLTILAILLTVTLAGIPCYLSPIQQRVRSPYHAWLKPTGWIGQSAGLLAFTLFLFLWLYPLRKKFRSLSFTGSVKAWLDVHILCGLTIPWLGAIHAGWRFEGLIGLGYAAMLLVVGSGIVGKHIYARIPRRRSGIQLSVQEEGVAVLLSYRGERFQRVQDRNREKLDDGVARKRIGVLLQSQLSEIREGAVTLTVAGAERIVEADDVIIRIGGDPPFRFLERIGVRMLDKDVPLAAQQAAGGA